MARQRPLQDPAQDAAAGDVLVAFEAAQGNGLSSVDCYRAAVEAWRRAHPDHAAPYAVRIVLDVKASLRIEEV